MPQSLDVLSSLGAIGVPILFILLLLRELPGIINLFRKNGKNNKEQVDLKAMAVKIDFIEDKVDDLHNWLGARDSTGAFPWAVAPVLQRLADILDRMEKRQSVMDERQVRIDNRQQAMQDQLTAVAVKRSPPTR